MNESRSEPYDYAAHRHLSGVVQYRGRKIRYRPGRMSQWLLEKKKFPKRTNVREWCDIILEIFERRATCTAYPYLWVPDDIWFSVIRYLDTVVNLRSTGVIDLRTIVKRVRPDAFYERAGKAPHDPTLYRSSDRLLLARGIDALLMNRHELSGKVEYVVPFSPYRVALTYRPGSLVRLFAREGRFENGVVEFVECIAEMKERMDKNINGPFLRVTRKMDDLFRRFIQFGAVYARTGEIDSRDPQLISEFRRHLHRAEKNVQSEAIDNLMRDLQRPGCETDRTDSIAPAAEERTDCESGLRSGPGAGSVEDRARKIIASLRAEATRRKALSRPLVAYVGHVDLYADTDPVERMDVDSSVEAVQASDRISTCLEVEPAPDFSFEPPDCGLGEDLEAAFESRGPTVGDQLGLGLVEGRLTSDGMAAVYRTHIRNHDLYRAVKVFNMLVVPVGQREVLAYHVLDELEKASKIRHPGFVEVHEIGLWNAFPYVETEYVVGTDLEDQIIRFGRLPSVVACAVAIAVCESLHFAHTCTIRHRSRKYAGLIHGDLKPTNIMISNEGQVKLLNLGTFGVFHEEAYIAGSGPDGSLRYCGFERLNSGPVDGRADLFSVGAVLYEMLAGVSAYEGNDTAAIMRARKSNSYRPITERNPEISGDLAEVVERCLKRDPDDRPDDVAEVLEFLRYTFDKLSKVSPTTVVKEWFRGTCPIGRRMLRSSFLPPGRTKVQNLGDRL